MEPMFPAAISNSTCMTDDEVITASSVSRVDDFRSLNSIVIQSAVSSSSPSQQQPQIKIKKKRNLPGNPDPDAEVIALSPKTLLATNRSFICEICNKGFQRDQNLQLHRRGHNLPWKLKQRNNNSTKEIKKRAYVCPEPSCVHHHPSRALGDLTGIKKHFSRKHGEKKWMCEKCSKIYAVQSDWKAHTKTCGTREYKCHCGTLFSRKDSFITHRAFCDALAEESARLSANSIFTTENTTFGTAIRPPPPPLSPPPFFSFTTQQHQQLENPSLNPMYHNNPSWNASSHIRNPKSSITHEIKPEAIHFPISTPFNYPEHPQKSYVGPSSFQVQNLLQSSVPQLSATALLQRASSLGAHSVGHVSSTLSPLDMRNISIPPPPVFGTWQENSDRLTRDFLGLTGEQFIGTGVGMGNGGNVDVNVNVNMRGVLSFTGRVEFPAYNERADLSALAPNHHQNFGYLDPNAPDPGTWRNC